jgi:hypothetical protein
MKGCRFLVIACLTGTFVGCTPPSSTTPPHTTPTETTPAAPDHFGNAGSVKGKVGGNATHISVTQLQHGDQLACNILGQLPGQDPAPVALLLFRRRDPARLGLKGDTAESTGNIAWRGSLTAANGKPFLLAYDIDYKPVADKLQLGVQTYDFDSGRFFLIDLSQDPVTPVQFKEKIVPLLPSHDPTEAELKAAIETLKEKQETVRAFLEDAH